MLEICWQTKHVDSLRWSNVGDVLSSLNVVFLRWIYLLVICKSGQCNLRMLTGHMSWYQNVGCPNKRQLPSGSMLEWTTSQYCQLGQYCQRVLSTGPKHPLLGYLRGTGRFNGQILIKSSGPRRMHTLNTIQCAPLERIVNPCWPPKAWVLAWLILGSKNLQ